MVFRDRDILQKIAPGSDRRFDQLISLPLLGRQGTVLCLLINRSIDSYHKILLPGDVFCHQKRQRTSLNFYKLEIHINEIYN